MKCYIVNLDKDIERRKYITSILKNWETLEPMFISAIYGKGLSSDELNSKFDLPKSYKRYGRNLNPGEIGCTLSHFKCFNTLLNSTDEHVLILEDDITILRDISEIETLTASLPKDRPWVIFLSADYWYTSLRSVSRTNSIANVYDAVGTYAYVINRKGAELLLKKNPRPSSVADNWSLYRRQGLKLYAVYPYMIDANIESFESSIEQNYFGEIRKNMPLSMRIQAYWLSAIKHFLLRFGHFVSKIRK